MAGRGQRGAHRRLPDTGTLRIIGGRWRGRKLTFPALAGLRPTPDRVRETLFNWLSAELPGARCLDLFAGSGALGLEALSRGAGHVLFADADRNACRAIRDHLALLDCDDATIACEDALALLERGPGPQGPVDIAFLDPPFGSGLLASAAAALQARDWLSPDGRIYLEQGRRESEAVLPASWACLRDKTAGDVRYRLFARDQPVD